MSYTLIHLLSVVSLIVYAASLLLLYSSSERKFSTVFLLIGVFSHFLSLLVLISTEYRIQESVRTIDSSPSLLLIVCSFVIFLLYLLSGERSRLFSACFIGIGILLFILGGASLHSGAGSLTYEVSAVLLVHILFSVVSQVSVFFVLIFSFLILVLHQNLKKKIIAARTLPDLVTLEKMLVSSLQGALVFLVVSLATGVFQKELLDVHIVKLLFSLGYFMFFAIAIFLIQMKKLVVPVLSFYLFTSTFVLLMCQFFYRLI
jgi:ABC-type uncharacterized transport system permease subunit